MKMYFIQCRTGCTCCQEENHWRGPYATRADAKRRIASFLSKDSVFWPLASQYARRGVYNIYDYEVETISNDRVIIDNKVHPTPKVLVVADNGDLVGTSNTDEGFDL